MLPSLSLAGNRLARALDRLRRHPPASPTPRPVQSRSGPNLRRLAQADAVLPAVMVADPVARKYLDLLGPLDWDHFPERA